ncbi:MAG: hypothetical protein J5I90_19945 [Caldilineales bacterium]|nr:hypothetical protein [Caldilineales bacterium]
MNQQISDTVSVFFDSSGAPEQFLWRGRSFRVEMVERIWRSGQQETHGPRTYRVRAAGRTFLLRHDRRHRRWQMMRSPLSLRLGLTLEGWAMRMTP